MGAVDSPAHYNGSPSGIECIEVVEWMNFNLGNVVKYVWRHGVNDSIQDLEKAKWYITREIMRLKGLRGLPLDGSDG